MEQKKTVLIVEDEKNIVDIIRFNLQRTGYNTLEAYDGEAGLAMARVLGEKVCYTIMKAQRRRCAVAEKKGIKIAAQNRKAFHDYFVEDRYEAGIELKGTEVKSIRAGTLNLKDSYVIVKNGEANVLSMHISPYDKGNIFNHDPDRPKKLLLHKREIGKL